MIGKTLGTSDIWVWDTEHRTLTRLTFEGINRKPIWTPDGKRIAFSSLGSNLGGGVNWKAGDGTGKEEWIGSIPDGYFFPFCFSSDAKNLVGAPS